MEQLSFNFEHSNAIFVGYEKFNDDNLADLPAIRNNLDSLIDIFSDSQIIGFDKKNLHLINNPNSSTVGREISRIASDTFDTLFLYYAGHGKINDDGELCLTVQDTDVKALDFTSIPFKSLKNIIQKSPAQKKIVILDSCFSGRAIDFMGEFDDIGKSLEIEGIYLITSVAKNKFAKAYDNDKVYTAFSSVFIKTLENGISINKELLSINDIYKNIQLNNTIFNEPQRAVSQSINDFLFSYNKGFQEKKEFSFKNNSLISNENTIISRAKLDFIREIEKKNGKNQQRFIAVSKKYFDLLNVREGEWIEISYNNGIRETKEYATIFIKPFNFDASIVFPLVIRNLLKIEIDTQSHSTMSIVNPKTNVVKIKKFSGQKLDKWILSNKDFISWLTLPDEFQNKKFNYPPIAIRNLEFELLGLKLFDKVELEVKSKENEKKFITTAIQFSDNPGRAVIGIDKLILKDEVFDDKKGFNIVVKKEKTP